MKNFVKKEEELPEEMGEEGHNPPMAKLSSCPKLFYLDQSLDNLFHDATIIAGLGGDMMIEDQEDGAPPRSRQLRTHVAVLGATCAVLKDALLAACLNEEQEVVILAPDYSILEIQTFIRVLCGKADQNEKEAIQGLLDTVGFGKKPRPRRASLSFMKPFVKLTRWDQDLSAPFEDITEVNALPPALPKKRGRGRPKKQAGNDQIRTDFYAENLDPADETLICDFLPETFDSHEIEKDSTPPKKRRGRPKKQSAAAKDKFYDFWTDKIDIKQDENEPPKKRQRGRPKKQNVTKELKNKTDSLGRTLDSDNDCIFPAIDCQVDIKEDKSEHLKTSQKRRRSKKEMKENPTMSECNNSLEDAFIEASDHLDGLDNSREEVIEFFSGIVQAI